MTLTDDEKKQVEGFFLLTSKPVIYCCNISEKMIGCDNEYTHRVEKYAAAEGATAIEICAKVEAEIAQLPKEERPMFLEDLARLDGHPRHARAAGGRENSQRL